MKPLHVQLDDLTFRALHCVAPTPQQKKDFVRAAIWSAIREGEESRTRRAYEAMPDDETGSWSNAGPDQ